MEKDPLRDLEDRRRELQERWFVYRGSSRREGVKSAAWVALGVIGVAADVAVLGGLGTVMATVSGMGFFAYRKEVKRLEKELKSIDSILTELREERAKLDLSGPALAAKPSIQAEFSPAAQRKVDGLQARLDELEKSIEKITGPKAPDKPKFGT